MNWFESAKALLEKWKAQEKASRLSLARFTPRAQQILVLARKEADRLNHDYLGTEHLLLGIVKLGQGVAVNVLVKMGFDLETIRKEIEKQISPNFGEKMTGTPYTPRVKRVLQLALEEADALKHAYIGTEHILLGLLRDGGGVAGRVLKSINVETEQFRKEVLRELDPNFLAGDDGQMKSS